MKSDKTNFLLVCSFKNLKERAEVEYMSHAEQDKEGVFSAESFTLGSASQYSQNQTLKKEVKECKKEREKGGFASIHHSFSIFTLSDSQS